MARESLDANSSPGAHQEGESNHSEAAILSIGDVASRHLIARTSERDILAKSIEQHSQEVQNQAELLELMRAVTRPYELLFIDHAAEQPIRGPKKWFGAGTGGWSYKDVTPEGLLTTEVTYEFQRSRRGPLLREAKAKISGVNEATANLGLTFDQNAIESIALTWEGGNWSPRHPHTLLRNLSNTRLGEFIDYVLGPNVWSNEKHARVSLKVEELGGVPQILAARRSERYYKRTGAEKTEVGVFEYFSSLLYHSDKNAFVRHKGLGEISDEDRIAGLSNPEFTILVHELLKLVPTVSID